MLSRQFLSWADSASAGERADAARDLARAYLYAEIDRIELGEMERAMTCLIDDPSPLVRRALAEALAGAADAPHHLVSALANDAADIAALVLARSPVLSDAELIDAAALGDMPAQCAIASRPNLSAAVAGAVAEVGRREAVLALCRNDGATLAEISARRILERFGQDGDIRSSLGARGDLGPALRQDLVAATGEALRRFVTACGWMTPERARRVVGDARERAAVVLAEDAAGRDGEAGRLAFVAHLRRSGMLTPALVLRALMSGRTGLFEAALADLSGQKLARVAGLVRNHDGLAFAALLRSSGLPDSLLPAVRAALGAGADGTEAVSSVMLRRRLVSRALAECLAAPAAPDSGLTALLRRFESEAAREESRVAPAVRAAEPPRTPLPRPGDRIEPRFDAELDLAVAA